MFETEIVFSNSSSTNSRALSKALRNQKIRKICPKVFTTNLEDTLENIVRRNLFLILGHLFQGAVLSFRTAIEGGLSKDNNIVLSYKYSKKLTLADITVQLIAGHGELPGDTAFVNSLFLASRARAMLENCRISRSSPRTTVPQEVVEQKLEQIINNQGLDALNTLRDQAKKLSIEMDYKREFTKLNQLISALQSTHRMDVLKTPSSIARAQNKPFDNHRLHLFGQLMSSLKTTILPEIRKTLLSESLKNFAFFEAYFSNYIEGTRFEIDEAVDIVLHNRPVINRPKDCHDIMATYELVSDPNVMATAPTSLESLLELLCQRHGKLMAVHDDIRPGQFKQHVNRAGNTTFVSPELVLGTLEQAFSLYQSLEPGFERMAFMMFIISEVHPFDDGNGRLARIMMNAEADASGYSRIIIPNVYREDYILSLRKLSRQGDADAYVRMLNKAQRWTASIDYSSYESALMGVSKTNAFEDPSEGKLLIPPL